MTGVIFKSRLCVQVQPYRRATQQMKRSGKEYITHKPAIEWEHLKQLKARGSCSLFSLLYFKKSGSILFLPFVEDSVKDRELNHQKVEKCPPCAVCFQLFQLTFWLDSCTLHAYHFLIVNENLRHIRNTTCYFCLFYNPHVKACHSLSLEFFTLCN